MKAAQFTTYGGPDVIKINPNAQKPQLKNGQVLVAVHAVSINPVESAIRNGYMQQMLPLTFPVNAGGDFSGVISEVEEDVTSIKVGDEVYGVANHFKGGSGSLAEYVAANADNTSIKPKSIDHAQASSLPLVGTSAIQTLEEHIRLSKGQKILIHGGAGGIGSLAIQLAKYIGAYVATTVSADDVNFVKSLGADQVIDYKVQKFEEVVQEFDAVYDTVGGETTNRSLAVLRKGGILVSTAGQPDQDLVKQHSVTALTQMTAASTKQLDRLTKLVDMGVIKPQIDRVFSFDQTREAFDYAENGHPKGKVVVKIRE